MQHHKIIIVGIGTNVGKTVAAAIITHALQATYFKPIQCGFTNGTDAQWVQQHTNCKVLNETFLLSLPASPHLAAQAESVVINIDPITTTINNYRQNLVIEGAGGIMVPINNTETFLNALAIWNLPTIIISRNYLGSINHSLLTALALKHNNINKCAWLFNDDFMGYEADISTITNLPSLGKIPNCNNINRKFITAQALILKPALLQWLNN